MSASFCCDFRYFRPWHFLHDVQLVARSIIRALCLFINMYIVPISTHITSDQEFLKDSDYDQRVSIYSDERHIGIALLGGN